MEDSIGVRHENRGNRSSGIITARNGAQGQPPGEAESSCGSPLPREQIVETIRRAIEVTGGDASKLDEEYRLSIHESGCKYIVVGVRQPEIIAQEFAITIDRSGRVESWPWCCVSDFAVGPLDEAEDSGREPEIVITDSEGRSWPLDTPGPSASCTPALFELDRAVEVRTGAWTISFRLVAVGCAEDLGKAWPPSLDRLEQAFTPELEEPHPVQTLIWIRERSPELRARLTKRLNEVLEDGRAVDVFLFDAEGSEH